MQPGGVPPGFYCEKRRSFASGAGPRGRPSRHLNERLYGTTQPNRIARGRRLSIHPEAEITARCERVNGEWLKTNGLEGYDYLIDAIDSVADKTDLILYASRVRELKTFSSMGAALRFDPTQVTTGELMTIKGDALAKAVRARMKRIDAKPSKKIRCVYSTEQAQACETRGSLMQVTAVFGCTLASLVINDICKHSNQ